jgi:hypothetical protein
MTPRLRPHAEGIGEVVMGIAAGLGAPVAVVLVAASGFSSLALVTAGVASGVVVYVRWATPRWHATAAELETQ